MQRFKYPDQKEDVLTTRNFASSYLFVDSADRYLIDKNGIYLNDFEINPNNILINNQKTLGIGSLKRLALTELSFPFVSPNINNFTDTFDVTNHRTNETYSITLDEGFYTREEIATALEDGLNNLTGNSTWSVTVEDDFYFNFSISSPTSGDIWAFEGDTEFDYLIGTVNLPKLTAQNNYNVSGGYAPMYYTRYIDIVSSTLTRFQNVKDSQTQQNLSDQVYRLYIDDPTKPAIINKVVSNPKFMEWNENNAITSLDFKLYDDRGRLLYIPEADWNTNYLLTFIMSES